MSGGRVPSHIDGMRKATTDALTFVAGMTEEDFLNDYKTQAAVAMCLTVIGEAASRIALTSPDFLLAHPEWPWNEMRGMRNRIVHAYDTLNVPVMWLTTTQSLPELKALLNAL